MSSLLTSIPIKKQRSEQKCWGCKWATGLPVDKTGMPCPWTMTGEDRKPVPGWTAVKRIKKSDSYGYEESYDLTEKDYCPLFTEDDKSQYKIIDKKHPWWN